MDLSFTSNIMTRYYFGDPGLGVSVPTSIHNSATEIKGGVSL